jgi:hypothetical protein
MKSQFKAQPLNPALVAQLETAKSQQYQYTSSWLEHPVTKRKITLIREKQKDFLNLAHLASQDVTKHAQCVQYIAASNNIEQVINILLTSDNAS